MKKKILERLVRCPTCERNVHPRVIEEVAAVELARPPIPARLVVKCQAKGCGQKFYVVKDA